MKTEVIQIHNTSSEDFKKEISKIVNDAINSKSIDFQENHGVELMTREETANFLSISLVTLWSWTKKNIIPAYRIGNKVRYKKNEVMLALEKVNGNVLNI